MIQMVNKLRGEHKYTITFICVTFLFFSCLPTPKRNRFAKKSKTLEKSCELVTQATKVSAIFKYKLITTSPTSRFKLTFPIPTNILCRQRLLKLEVLFPKYKLYRNNNQTYISLNIRSPPKIVQIEVRAVLLLWKYDLSVAKNLAIHNKVANTISMKERDPYLKHEQYIERDYFRKIAQKIQANSREELVKKIIDYVAKRIKWPRITSGTGAWKAWKSRAGNCAEHAEMTVAICRAKNIPARYVSGVTSIMSKNKTTHGWVEIYFPRYGWVPFDPIDIAKNYTEFDKLKRKYIYLNRFRRDPNLSFHTGFYYVLWSDPSKPFKFQAETTLKVLSGT